MLSVVTSIPIPDWLKWTLPLMILNDVWTLPVLFLSLSFEADFALNIAVFVMNSRIIIGEENITELLMYATHFTEKWTLPVLILGPSNIPTAEIEIQPPSYEETLNAIKTLKNNKAPGSDGIPAECIKSGGETLHKAIHKPIQNIWKTETLPDSSEYML